MLDRLRNLLRSRGEVLGGGDSDDTAFSGAAPLGGVGAVSDRHPPRADDDSVAHTPKHGDDEFEPPVPPERSG
jgi:hypothetical protein